MEVHPCYPEEAGTPLTVRREAWLKAALPEMVLDIFLPLIKLYWAKGMVAESGLGRHDIDHT